MMYAGRGANRLRSRERGLALCSMPACGLPAVNLAAGTPPWRTEWTGPGIPTNLMESYRDLWEQVDHQ
jgi:hypothetical protein